jgi:hypothetical protein
MKISRFFVLIAATLLLLSGCGKFNPQKNLLPHSAYGWWHLEMPRVGGRPPHVFYLQINKENAILYDFARGFGTRATGVYNFHPDSKRGKGEFDIHWRGTALGSDRYIGNWTYTIDYRRKGFKATLALKLKDQTFPLEYRFKERAEELIVKDLTTDVQDMMRREPATKPDLPARMQQAVKPGK